uniref:Uncharacterized protein n=1 Tax=Quercus lobata TaxID=97700 RepID=A0A7N2MTU2_QUELO
MALQGKLGGGILWSKDDAYARVMGLERSGHVRGVGFGLTPSGRNGENLSQSALTPLLTSTGLRKSIMEAWCLLWIDFKFGIYTCAGVSSWSRFYFEKSEVSIKRVTHLNTYWDALTVLYQVHIVKRGVVQPLIEMLKSLYAQLGEMSAFVLGRLAKDKHNQAGIAHSGGIVPPLRLIDSRNGALQHNSAYSYGIFKS